MAKYLIFRKLCNLLAIFWPPPPKKKKKAKKKPTLAIIICSSGGIKNTLSLDIVQLFMFIQGDGEITNTNIEAQIEGVDEDALIRQGLHRV